MNTTRFHCEDSVVLQMYGSTFIQTLCENAVKGKFSIDTHVESMMSTSRLCELQLKSKRLGVFKLTPLWNDGWKVWDHAGNHVGSHCFVVNVKAWLSCLDTGVCRLPIREQGEVTWTAKQRPTTHSKDSSCMWNQRESSWVLLERLSTTELQQLTLAKGAKWSLMPPFHFE